MFFNSPFLIVSHTLMCISRGRLGGGQSVFVFLNPARCKLYILPLQLAHNTNNCSLICPNSASESFQFPLSQVFHRLDGTKVSLHRARVRRCEERFGPVSLATQEVDHVKTRGIGPFGTGLPISVEQREAYPGFWGEKEANKEFGIDTWNLISILKICECM